MTDTPKGPGLYVTRGSLDVDEQGSPGNGAGGFILVLVIGLLVAAFMWLPVLRSAESIRGDVVLRPDIAAEDACDPADRPQRVDDQSRTGE